MTSIYVARGTGGIIKAGKTRNVESRIRSLKQQFRRFGHEMVEWSAFAVADKHVMWTAEVILLRKMEAMTPYYGREWFTGDFHVARELAKEAVVEAIQHWVGRKVPIPPSPEEAEQRRREAIAQKEQVRIARQERRAAFLRAIDERRVLREQRRADMTAVATRRAELAQEAA